MPDPSEHQELGPDTARAVETLFTPGDRARARDLLQDVKVRESERCQLAALKLSDGRIDMLEEAVKLARIDHRDLLIAAGFGEAAAHLKWKPKPAGEPSEIDPLRLAEGIHERIGVALAPDGFQRMGEEWVRSGEVTQRLTLIRGVTSRVETRFFLRLTIEAQPLGVTLQLPKLPKGPAKVSAEQGYIFRAGGSEDALFIAAAADAAAYVTPWFSRFTTSEEVQRGFDDGTFKPNLKLKDQPFAIVF